MNRSKGRRGRLGGLLVLALGLLALLALPGVAAAKDRNHDHIPDRWEKRHKLSLKVNQARRDQDGDHLRNLAEFKAGDNPRNSDSDGDGIPDGEENAGTIASFDPATGKLVINLFGGEAITGLVTEGTEIECGGSSDHGESSDDESGATTSSQGQNSGSSDSGDDENEDSGSNDGSSSSSDDDSGQGTECTTADLVAGAVVKEAELDLSNGVATFSKVELAD